MDGSAGGPSPQSSGFLCQLIHVAGARERGSHGGFWVTLKPRVLSAWSVMGWEGESSWDAAGRDKPRQVTLREPAQSASSMGVGQPAGQTLVA